MNEMVDNETKQYLTFKLGEEIFGVDVTQIREILECPVITKIPQAPEFMCGVINLRGSVVPVIDMQQKFGMGKIERTINTCIIVAEIKIESKGLFLGALVDSIQEVFELEPRNIEAAPKIGMGLKTDFIKGMGKRGDKFIMLLDISRVFSFDELELVQSTNQLNIKLSIPQSGNV